MLRELLAKASVSAEAAHGLFDDGCVDDAVSRADYAMFNAARALLVQIDHSHELLEADDVGLGPGEPSEKVRQPAVHVVDVESRDPEWPGADGSGGPRRLRLGRKVR